MSEIQRKPNRLIHEKSPYLLQHAYNPVDWFPWSEEAFSKAKEENKPILLSIGYATCHWCHVMERESFEDHSTAEQLNRDFVCIKLDREERPDIDKIYMDALHAMGQQGGWPLNMFLTPDKKPIMGGTYFPPIPKYGRKSFKEVLSIIRNAWDNRREEILKSANSLVEYLLSESAYREDSGLPSQDSFNYTFQLYSKYFDEVYYGFRTNHTNKFPPSMGLSFLLFYYYKTGNQHSLYMVEKTLEAMKKGGIYDQIGGGLCRYSTNHSWLIPHFEKMLYDNSLFLTTLSEAFLITKNQFYEDAIRDVIQYIERDMRLESGGVASAEDADSEGVEGKFYTWDYKEFEEICGKDAPLLSEFWNVSEDGNFEEKNILNESFNIDFCESKGLNRNEFHFILKNAKEAFLRRRETRIRPLRDDKVLTSWNCLYIQSLVNSGISLNENEYLEKAKITYDFIYQYLFDSQRRLLRRYREGEAKYFGYLVDYAELILASLKLYRAFFDTKYVENAIQLTQNAIQLFGSDFGPFYETGIDGEKLIRRSIDGYDGVEPSGNSTMAYCLLQLASLGIHSDTYTNLALGIFKYFKAELETRAISHPFMLSAYQMYQSPIKEIVVVYSKSSYLGEDAIHLINQFYIPDSVVVASPKEDLHENSQIIPLLEGRESNKEFAVYICHKGVCDLPIYNLEDLQIRLKGFSQ
jgi:uncharacterized protein YyaL (SSP411 family)